MVETSFVSPGPELNETKTAEGFDRSGYRDPVMSDADGEVCRFFALAGWCKYGDACRHKHVQGVPQGVPWLAVDMVTRTYSQAS